MTFDSLYQAETFADELRRGYGDAIQEALYAAERIKLNAPGSGDTPYWRGAKCAVAAIEALRQDGA